MIRAQVRNQDTALRPGMFARVKLITRAERDALVVPEEALVPQGTEQYVFKVTDGKVARIKVETGQRRDGKVEIVNGVGARRRDRHRGSVEAARRRVRARGRRRRRAEGGGGIGRERWRNAGVPPSSGLVTPANAAPAAPAQVLIITGADP